MKKKITALITAAVLMISFISAHAENSDQFQGIDMSALIGAPLGPAYPWEHWNWQDYLNSLLNSEHNDQINYVDFRRPDGGVISVPLLSIVPIPESGGWEMDIVLVTPDEPDPEPQGTYNIEVHSEKPQMPEGLLNVLEMMNSTVESTSQNRLGVNDNNTLTQLEGMTTLWEIYALEIMNGSDDGNLMLGKEVTKAEFVKMIVTALGKKTLKPSSQSAHWAEGYVRKGIADGWITENLADFDYNKQVTYAEAETMLAKVLGYGDDTDSIDFSNGTAYQHDSEIITRYQAAVMLHNALNTPLCIDGEIMNGKGDNYRTLLTEVHSIYTACGYIESVSDLEDSYRFVRFTAQESDNLNGEYIDKNDESTYIAIDTLLDDAQADHYEGKYVQVLLKNRDNEFYSILSIRNLEI